MTGIAATIEKIKSFPRYRDNRTGQYVLSQYAWPGGYEVVAYTDDGEMVCTDCANEEDQFGVGKDSGFKVEGADIYWEGPVVHCCHCNREIESAYGDPS